MQSVALELSLFSTIRFMACNSVLKFVDLYKWNDTFIAKECERKLPIILLFNQFSVNKSLLMVKYTDLYCWNKLIVTKHRTKCYKKHLNIEFQYNQSLVRQYKKNYHLKIFDESSFVNFNCLEYLNKCIKRKDNFAIIGDNFQIS